MQRMWRNFQRTLFKKDHSCGHGIKISVEMVDIRGVSHISKRMFKELERQKVDQQMLSTKAANWRCKATKVMVYGDPEPNYLYSSNILRKVHQEVKNKDLG